MKKALVVLLILAVAGGLFADDPTLKWTGWGRGTFSPIIAVNGAENSDLDGVYTGQSVGWGESPIRIGAEILGTADKIGFRLHIIGDQYSGGDIAIGDYASIWAKPFSFLRIDMGHFNYDAIRGKIGAPGALTSYALGAKGEHEIFNRFQGRNGFLVGLFPIEGLYIGALVNNLGGSAVYAPGATLFNSRAGTESADVFKGGQYAVAYTIPNIGLARVQYIGVVEPTVDTTKATTATVLSDAVTASRIEAAFQFTGVTDLNIDLGGKYYLPATISESGVDYTGQLPIQVSLGAKYTAGSFDITARADLKVAGKVTVDASGYSGEVTEGLALNAHVWPFYNLGFAKVGADIGFELVPEVTAEVGGTSTTLAKGGNRIGVGANLDYPLGNGNLVVGLYYKVGVKVNEVKEAGIFSVPVQFTYSF